MFRLKNRWGNIYKEVKTEREKDELEKQGYTVVAAETEKSLDEMTVPELEAYAKEKGIDLGCCTNKAEKLARIKAAEGCQ